MKSSPHPSQLRASPTSKSIHVGDSISPYKQTIDKTKVRFVKTDIFGIYTFYVLITKCALQRIGKNI